MAKDQPTYALNIKCSCVGDDIFCAHEFTSHCEQVYLLPDTVDLCGVLHIGVHHYLSILRVLRNTEYASYSTTYARIKCAVR